MSRIGIRRRRIEIGSGRKRWMRGADTYSVTDVNPEDFR